MSKIDDLLEKYNLKYSDLTLAEKETAHKMLTDLQEKQLTVEKIKEYIAAMRDSVEVELTNTDNGSKQDLFLKARLRNYMLLESFLVSPERAKRALERSISNLSK